MRAKLNNTCYEFKCAPSSPADRRGISEAPLVQVRLRFECAALQGCQPRFCLGSILCLPRQRKNDRAHEEEGPIRMNTWEVTGKGVGTLPGLPTTL
jgi:hypothetical protein